MDTLTTITKSKENNRIAWIDMAKLLSIYLVVLGHAIQYLRQGVSPMTDEVWLFIYSFHMPLFMLIAGYFSVRATNEPLLVMAKNKSVQLLLPCLTWGLVWIVLRQTQPQITPPQKELSVYVMDVLWFLKSLFVCLILYRIFKKNTFLIVISIVLSQILPFKVPLMYPCFLIGVYCKKVDLFNKISLRHALIFIALFFISYHFFLPQYMNSNLRSSAMQLLYGNFMPFITEICTRIYRLFVGIVGSLALISSVKILTKVAENNVDTSFMSKFGTQTQAVYILHGPIVAFIVPSLIDFSSMNTTLFDYMIAPLVALLLLLFCFVIINMVPKRLRVFVFGTKN